MQKETFVLKWWINEAALYIMNMTLYWLVVYYFWYPIILVDTKPLIRLFKNSRVRSDALLEYAAQLEYIP